eukprot:4767548-Lingulodinium_polyedra.AAC.1
MYSRHELSEDQRPKSMMSASGHPWRLSSDAPERRKLWVLSCNHPSPSTSAERRSQRSIAA